MIKASTFEIAIFCVYVLLCKWHSKDLDLVTVKINIHYVINILFPSVNKLASSMIREDGT
jgi:hypothetical protein